MTNVSATAGMKPFIPAATLVTFSALTLFPFPLERVYSTVSPSSKFSKSPHISLRGEKYIYTLMKENLLVMVCSLNEAKVVLECGNKSQQSLGVGGITVEDPDGDCALQAGILGGGCHYFLLHYTHKSLLRLGMEGHCALGQLLDAYCVVPLSRQHIL
ncbi:hypothetical protein F7725_000330, partial [Dissostichus mawsoni]